MATAEQRAARQRITELEERHGKYDRDADEQTRTSPVPGGEADSTPKKPGWQKRRGTHGEEVWIDPDAGEED